MNNALTNTEFHFQGQKSVYHGKVRDVYNINDEKLVMVATDRISAFDVILPRGIPFKGQVLNQIAANFLDATSDICPAHYADGDVCIRGGELPIGANIRSGVQEIGSDLI